MWTFACISFFGVHCKLQLQSNIYITFIDFLHVIVYDYFWNLRYCCVFTFLYIRTSNEDCCEIFQDTGHNCTLRQSRYIYKH